MVMSACVPQQREVVFSCVAVMIKKCYVQGKDDSMKDIFPEVSQWMSGAPGLPSALFFPFTMDGFPN